ncbi:MAG: hypothetical protein K9J13_07380, partial [Saprospiraceae bacterium]|nr:hypothetical protein [Saprospiraceae bacterium]
MQNFSYLLSDWTDELNSTLIENNSFCVALFSTNGNLLFANEAMKHHLIDESKDSLINPTFNKLLTLDYSNILIFKGFLTLGDYSSVNTSILSNIFRKNDKILILGGVNAIQLQEQNANIHKLNQENLNLQRKLIKEKLILENILSKLNDANVELKKLNEDKDSFMSILAHDLRSPFSALIGFSD